MKIKLTFGFIAALLVLTAFTVKPKELFKLKKTFTENFGYVPNGSVTIDDNKVETSAFYMLKTEVTNAQYQEFLNSLINEDEVKKYQIQADKWTSMSVNAEPFKEHYHTHPAYQNYPVVNVTREGAEAYCAWLTEQYNNMEIGLPEGYSIVFRLPARSEWVHAANGGKTGPYSWGGPFLRNTKGSFLANFVRFGPENIHRNPETGEYEVVKWDQVAFMGTAGNMNDNADVLAPANSYAPNPYGLKNMNGNAAEILADIDQAAGGSWRCPGYDIRNESLMSYNEASPEVGFRPIGVIAVVN